MSPTHVDEINARIAEIQTRMSGSSRAASTVNSGTAFAQTLGGVLGAAQGDAINLNDYLAPSSTTGITGQSAVDEAKKSLGVPYVWGGTDAKKGLDCSGLVQVAYRNLGIELPRVAADQAREGTRVASLAQAKPGDLVAFGSPVNHIGIYVGDNKMIVAPKRGDVVKIQDIYQTPVAIRRIIPDTGFSADRVFASGGMTGALSSQYNSLFTQAGAKHGVSANLLAAVAKQESGFNPRAVSPAGAQGLMQLMPGTAKGLGVTNSFDPAQAVDGAAKMLSGLVQKFGSVELALAGYNAGPGAVQQYGGVPPYKETQNYVKNVMALVRQGGGL